MSSDHKQTKPMMATAKQERSVNVPLVSPSNSLLSENEHRPKSKVCSLSSIINEVKNSKRKLNYELNNLLTKLIEHKYGWVFKISIDGTELGMEDYLTIVKKPMDLGKVKAKLRQGLYKSPLDFAEDVRLTFNNAMLYCPVGQDVHIMAETLLSLFEEMWVSIEEQFRNLPYIAFQFHPPIIEPLPSSTVTEDTVITTSTTSIEKPREEEEAHVDDRDLTRDERRRLCEELGDLPHDKQVTVAQIIYKTNPELFKQDGETDHLDIGSVDIQTLWELNRFVTEYKESLSNKKEDQEFVSGRDADSDSDSSSGRGSDTGN